MKPIFVFYKWKLPFIFEYERIHKKDYFCLRSYEVTGVSHVWREMSQQKINM